MFDFDTSGRSLKRRMGVHAGTGLALQARGLVTLPLNIAVLGVAGLGFMTSSLAVASVVSMLAMANIPDGAARLILGAPTPEAAEARLAEQRRWAIVPITLLTTSGALVLALTGSAALGTALLVAASMVILKIGVLPYQVFQRASAYNALQLFAGYAVVAAALFAGWLTSPVGYLVVLALGQAMVGGWAWWRVRAVGEALPRRRFFRDCLAVSLPLLPVSVSFWAMTAFALVIVARKEGDQAAGMLSIALSLSSVVLALSNAIAATWPATVQRLLTTDVLALRAEQRRLLRLIIGITALISLAFLVAALWIVPLLPYERLNGSTIMAPLLTVAYGFIALAKLDEGVLYAIGSVRPIVVSYVVSAVGAVVLLLILVPLWGFRGAPVSMLVSAIILWGCMTFAENRVILGAQAR